MSRTYWKELTTVKQSEIRDTIKKAFVMGKSYADISAIVNKAHNVKFIPAVVVGQIARYQKMRELPRRKAKAAKRKRTAKVASGTRKIPVALKTDHRSSALDHAILHDKRLTDSKRIAMLKIFYSS